jgi:amphi-Trp domain-containing protein
MGDSQKVKFLSTVKKDEAAFYLSELARGLLKNRISIRVGQRDLVLTTFDSIHLEMNALERGERNSVDIHLSWRKPPLGIVVGRTDGHPTLGKGEELF